MSAPATLAMWQVVAASVKDTIADRGMSVCAVADAISIPRSTLRGRLRDGRHLTVDDT